MTIKSKNTIDPNIADLLANLKADINYSMNCAKIGTIQSFDGIKKTATVNIVFQRLLADGVTVVSYPTLVDVPVFTLQGGGGAIQFPITPGDTALVIFCDRNIDGWFPAGATAPPPTPRVHDLSDGIALLGLNALNSVLSNYIAATTRIFYAGAGMSLSTGLLTLISGGGAEIDLSTTLVAIKNATTTLGTLIQNFITVLTGLEVVGNIALTPASIAALSAQALLFETLLL